MPLPLERGDDFVTTRVAVEWCVAETGGVGLMLILTSVRTAWLPEMTAAIRAASARTEGGRSPMLTVFRLDKRYPVDIGFDANLGEIRDAHREATSSLSASAMVVEFDGLLGATLRIALAGLNAISQTEFPRSVHSSVVSGASWIAPYAEATRRRDVLHYVDAINRMKRELGCKVEPTSGVSLRAPKKR